METGTSQACAMRDNLTLFTGAGWSVYGLSADSVTANSNWKTKQKLNYPLISDTSLKFHEKLGIKKNGKGSRNVIVIQKEGKFIKELKSVTPAASLEVAKSAAGISGATVAKKDLVTTPVATDEKSEAKPGEATS